MPRRRLPYLLRETTRHGKVVFYVRKGDGPRVRVHGDYGSKEFMAGYQAALAGNTAPPQKAAAPTGTLGWLITAYHESGAPLSGYAKATRRDIPVDRHGRRATVRHHAANNPSGHVQAQAMRGRGVFNHNESFVSMGSRQ